MILIWVSSDITDQNMSIFKFILHVSLCRVMYYNIYIKIVDQTIWNIFFSFSSLNHFMMTY